MLGRGHRTADDIHEGASMSGDLVAWLRQQIEGDKSAAEIVSAGGYAPQRWDTDPPGQVNPAKLPEADAVTAALGIDPHDPAFPRHEFWTALVAWDRENIEPEDARVRESDLPVAIVNNGRRELDHIRRHDPQDTIARCEAGQAMLDKAEATVERYGEESVPARIALHFVELLGWGYRYRDGYQDSWAPPA
jgi:hypothetical protein